MEQQLSYPKTEKDLNALFDNLYEISKNKLEANEKPKFKGLLEIIQSDVNILSAIHAIKSNAGSNTAGIDGKVIKDILHKNYEEVIDMVKKNLTYYNVAEVRRVWIPKPGKKEKRPLSIPTIVDRIIQECIRRVIQPIVEAQFIGHSYGFRPWRDAHQAIKRITTVLHKTKYTWVVEGDISKFFDNVNHTVLLNQLWSMGIRDRRVLQIIKQMLKAGIMGENKVNPIGIPQGGIISPLLANVYLHRLDTWINREWEEKKTKQTYARKDGTFRALKKTNLKPAYFIRYADDWLLITDSKSSALKWKYRISKYLDTNLKLKLSDEKTLITNIVNRNVGFLGFNIKVKPEKIKGRKRAKESNAHITAVKPQSDKVLNKTREIAMAIKKFRTIPKLDNAIHQLNIINSKIRGLVSYFGIANNIGYETKKYSSKLQLYGYKKLKRYGKNTAVLRNCREVRNLLGVHQMYNQRIPALRVSDGCYIGLTNLSFVKWSEPSPKIPKETPYSIEGREIYKRRTKKTLPLDRADDLFNEETTARIITGKKKGKYNFEFYLNRGYVVNRDKFKCRVCRIPLEKGTIEVHHTKPFLPLDEVNKVQHLVTVCRGCHIKIHNDSDYSHTADKKTWDNLQKIRIMLKPQLM